MEDEIGKLIEKSKNRLSILSDVELLEKNGVNLQKLLDLIDEYLSDEEVKEIVESKVFSIKARVHIINRIKNDKIKSELLVSNSSDLYQEGVMIVSHIMKNIRSEYKKELLENQLILDKLFMEDIIEYFNELDERTRINMLMNPEQLEKLEFKEKEIDTVIQSFSIEKKVEILRDSEFLVNGLKTSEMQRLKIILSLGDEEKIELLKDKEVLRKIGILDKFDNEIISSFSDEKKLEVILSNEYGLSNSDLETVICTLDSNSLAEVLKRSELMEKLGVEPYEITQKIPLGVQLDFVENFDESNLSELENRKIFLTLDKTVKDKVDVGSLSEKYVEAMSINISEKLDSAYNIDISYDESIEKYKGLDKFISVRAQYLVEEEDRENLKKLCAICPDITVRDDIDMADKKHSTGKEYIIAEEWIDGVLNNIDVSWTDLQKIAYIDKKIGEKISYTPDFGTETCNRSEARSLWKILNTGYGVCNGIAQIEQYILGREGIESERIDCMDHSFLKIEDIEFESEEGKVVSDAIFDPTWNLAANKYDARPSLLCISYEQARKLDIDPGGKDTMCHLNDEKLSSCTHTIDDEYLKELHHSIGFLNEDREFRITEMLRDNDEISRLNLDTQESINKRLELIKRYCPEFAQFNNSTIGIMKTVMESQKNIGHCVIDRVYSREDEKKNAVTYMYVSTLEDEKIFYVVDSEKEVFTKYAKNGFEEKFECYMEDLTRTKSRQWEQSENTNEKELALSSGVIQTDEER